MMNLPPLRSYRLGSPQSLGCFLFVCALLTAPSSTSELVAEEGRALVILEEEEPQTTYPILAKTMSEQRLGELLFDRLFLESLGGATTTNVFAEGWRVRPPNLTLIVEKDLKFSDGTPVSFSDVAFTLNDVYRRSDLGHGVGDWYSRVFGDAKQIADTAGSIPFLVSMPEEGVERYLQTTYLLSRDALSSDSQKPNLERTKRQPKGTGPFFAEATIENFDDIRLRRNPHRPTRAREGQTPVDQVRLLYDQDAARQRELMEGSRADLWVAPPAAVLPPFRNQRERFATRSYDLNQWWYIALNHGQRALSQPEVREALDLLLPRPQLLSKFGGEETAQLTSGPFLPGSAWESAESAPTANDRVRAEELLASVGYKRDGGSWVNAGGEAITLRLGVQADILDDYNDVVYAIQDAWESFGIRVRIRGIRTSDWTSITQNGGASDQHDMILGRWNVDREEASLELFRKAGSYGDQTNLFDWTSPEVEKLLTAFYKETSGPVREALMQKLHRHIGGERPYLFLWTLQVQSLYRRDKISGFRPSSYYYFTDIGRVNWRAPAAE
jgi:ABC-type transport system substrate-binding protein